MKQSGRSPRGGRADRVRGDVGDRGGRCQRQDGRQGGGCTCKFAAWRSRFSNRECNVTVQLWDTLSEQGRERESNGEERERESVGSILGLTLARCAKILGGGGRGTAFRLIKGTDMLPSQRGIGQLQGMECGKLRWIRTQKSMDGSHYAGDRERERERDKRER